jgi:Zn ribbon nucleic-acid-binding protein
VAVERRGCVICGHVRRQPRKREERVT